MQYPPAPQYTTPFKPGANATTTTVHGHNFTSSYNPVPGASHADPSIARLSSRDATLKRRIRLFKAIPRLLATVLSLATFLPLAMTLVKFFETRNETLTVNGEERTAWAAGTITWYTYLYFGVAAISLVLNTSILIAYCRSVKRANAVAGVADWWSYLQYVVEVLVRIASVAIYRYGRNRSLFRTIHEGGPRGLRRRRIGVATYLSREVTQSLSQSVAGKRLGSRWAA